LKLLLCKPASNASVAQPGCINEALSVVAAQQYQLHVGKNVKFMNYYSYNRRFYP
jgi:hypothetical protein